MGSLSYGQTETNQVSEPATVELTDEQLFTSRKPADAQPAKFASQADLDAKRSIKIENIKQKLIENRNNPDAVKILQEQLWRFENAVVSTSNK
jgi:hypothetical protein